MSGHVCHAEGCETPRKPEFLMCGRHWRMVPQGLQRAVWDAYVPGQEQWEPTPTEEWHAAANAAIEAVAVKEGRR